MTSSPAPRIALRRHDDGTLDDVVLENVVSVHAEQLDQRSLWIGVYFANGERATFYVTAPRRCLKFEECELPDDWENIDAGSAAA